MFNAALSNVCPCRPKKTAFRGRRFHEGCPLETLLFLFATLLQNLKEFLERFDTTG